MDDRSVDDRPEVTAFFTNLRAALPELEELKANCDGAWGAEDGLYRFYHQSFKVYGLQDVTKSIVDALAALAPHRQLNEWFLSIVAEGTGETFTSDHNRRWLEVTRPIAEAFLHARYFLDMACKYGRELEAPPNVMPSGWAAVLYLYQLR